MWHYSFKLKQKKIQQRLIESVWPYIRTNHVAHDDYFRFGNTVEFPEERENVPGIHIGQNWDAFLQTTHR